VLKISSNFQVMQNNRKFWNIWKYFLYYHFLKLNCTQFLLTVVLLCTVVEWWSTLIELKLLTCSLLQPVSVIFNSNSQLNGHEAKMMWLFNVDLNVGKGFQFVLIFLIFPIFFCLDLSWFMKNVHIYPDYSDHLDWKYFSWW